MSELETDNQFYLNVIGQIESCAYPYGGASTSPMFCRYEISGGADWQLVSGASNGVTQNSAADRRGHIVFNMPVEVMFKSTNPYGWPQITVSLFGRNRWGNVTNQGYARLHVPLGGGRRTILAPIFNAKCVNTWAALQSWLVDRNPELKDPKILGDGQRTKGLQLESFGEVIVSMQTITRGCDKLSLDWGQR